MRRLDGDLRSDAKPIDLDGAKWLYFDQDFSVARVAKVYGVAPCTVFRRFRRFGIELRPRCEAQKIVTRRCPLIGERNPSWKGGVSKKPYK